MLISLFVFHHRWYEFCHLINIIGGIYFRSIKNAWKEEGKFVILNYQLSAMNTESSTIEKLEAMISDCQKKIAINHRLLMEDELSFEETARLNEEIKRLKNLMFSYQAQLGKLYRVTFGKFDNVPGGIRT